MLSKENLYTLIRKVKTIGIMEYNLNFKRMETFWKDRLKNCWQWLLNSMEVRIWGEKIICFSFYFILLDYTA